MFHLRASLAPRETSGRFVNFSGQQSREALTELHRIIHSIKGSSASFRLSELRSLARDGDILLREAFKEGTTLGDQWHHSVQELMDRLEQVVATLDPLQGMETQVIEVSSASDKPTDRERLLVYLHEPDSYLRLSLETQLGCFGFRVLSFDTLAELAEAVQLEPPDAIVADVQFSDDSPDDVMLRTALDGIGTQVPLVIISPDDSLFARLEAVRAGSSAYFVKPVNMTELCSILGQLTSAVKQEPYRIMVVDDEPQLAEYHALILQEAGMMTMIVTDPLEIMVPLLEFKPDLILLDVYMPGCDGVELAKAIRQIDAFLSIPIVYLSGETDREKQSRVVEAGGEAFLVKPIDPQRLISTVAIRAERMKIIRSHMMRDSMTGLYNYTATKDILESTIAHARRQQYDVCYAMIDIDSFKAINDTYGHPSGDQVLIALSRLLSQRVRKSDVVGRIGGDEFSVILPACSLTEATELLQLVRESFAEVKFQAGDESFSCSISCGVAPYSRYEALGALIAGADEALYIAKHRGRNQVVAAGG